MKTSKLEKLNACREAIEWVKTQKSPTDAWQNCERGDWMLWITKRLNLDDRKLTLAKAMCVKQIEHLMKDQRSKDTLQAAIDYGNGKISREELNEYAYAAYAAAYTSASASASYAYAAYAAAYASASASASAAYAMRNSLKISADICREYLTEDVLKKYKNAKSK